MIIHLANQGWQAALARIWQWACGKNGGHSYETESLWTADGVSYVLDPLSTCLHCGLPLPMKIYDSVIESYDNVIGTPGSELW